LFKVPIGFGKFPLIITSIGLCKLQRKC